MFNKFLTPLIFSVVSIGCGCSHSIQKASAPTVDASMPLPAPLRQPQPPIQTSWQEVSKDNWSFKLPPEFVAQTVLPEVQNIIAVAYMAPDKTVFTFGIEKTDLNLDDYTNAAARSVSDNRGQVIQARKGHINNRDMTVLVATLPNSGALIGFFVVSAGAAYNLSCMLDGSAAEDRLKTCFEVAKTLAIK
jgi:hypothetical protein